MTVEEVQGRMIAANPAVQVVEVELSQYHSVNASHPNHTELFDVGSLLYTPEEVADYEQMLLGPTNERAVPDSSLVTTARQRGCVHLQEHQKTSSGAKCCKTIVQ